MSTASDFYIVAFDQEMALFCPDCNEAVVSVASATLAEFMIVAQHHQIERNHR